jgi:hypothetical protein
MMYFRCYNSAGPEVIRCIKMGNQPSKHKYYVNCKIVPILNNVISVETATSAIVFVFIALDHAAIYSTCTPCLAVTAL